MTECVGDKMECNILFTSVLDNDEQRNTVYQKVQQFISEKSGTSTVPIYVRQTGYENMDTGIGSSLTYVITCALRRHHLLPSARSSLLSLHDQYQAIQLCLARSNKKKYGEFVASASDVLDVWNELLQLTLTTTTQDEAKPESEDIDSLYLPEKRLDPSYKEMKQIIQDYQEFLVSSNCVDHFIIYKCLKNNLGCNQDFTKDIFSQAYIVEGVEEMPRMEKEIIKLIFKDSNIYKITTEFNMQSGSNIESEFDLSGINENHLNSSITDENNLNSSITDDGENNLNSSLNEGSKTENNLKSSSDSPSKPTPNKKRKDEIIVEKVDDSLIDYIKNNSRNCMSSCMSESELYILRVFLAHLRLLSNTRDELAVTVACSMPGREITQQAFSDIRIEAQKKNMPLYQTITSFILRHRLGGKGYQPDASHPVLLHVKPLGEFVDAIMKLQDILEEETNPKGTAEKILVCIKNNLTRIKGRIIKRNSIEKVWDNLTASLGSLVEKKKVTDKLIAQRSMENLEKITKRSPPLPLSLQYLVELCDLTSGNIIDGGIVDVLADNILTQLSSSKKQPLSSPVRIPTILSLFRSPIESDNTENTGTSNLHTRAMKISGIEEKRTQPQKRYKSVCAWAPADLSPINGGKGTTSPSSPIVGPSLKAVAREKATNWRQIVNSLDHENVDIGSKKNVSPVQNKELPGRNEANEENVQNTKKSSKRSLLSDISNVAKKQKPGDKIKKQNPEDKNGDKKIQEKPEDKKPQQKSKGKGKSKPLLTGQRSITSFFRV